MCVCVCVVVVGGVGRWERNLLGERGEPEFPDVLLDLSCVSRDLLLRSRQPIFKNASKAHSMATDYLLEVNVLAVLTNGVQVDGLKHVEVVLRHQAKEN